MQKELNFYVDDSGTRNPDRPSTSGSATKDWFALGGVLIKESDEGECRKRHAQFCDKWGITYPLHSADIRHGADRFKWLRSAPSAEWEKFMDSLSDFLLGIPAIGLACVIDRRGYNERYAAPYAGRRWLLCKTAFAISVERAAKYAISIGHKLNLYVERGDPSADRMIEGYFKVMKTEGAPFDPKNSGKYAPLSNDQLKGVLYDLKIKKKTSPGVQLADLYLWPMCMGGYHESNKPYMMLKKAGKLMDVICAEDRISELGIKYSCFEKVKRQP